MGKAVHRDRTLRGPAERRRVRRRRPAAHRRACAARPAREGSVRAVPEARPRHRHAPRSVRARHLHRRGALRRRRARAPVVALHERAQARARGRRGSRAAHSAGTPGTLPESCPAARGIAAARGRYFFQRSGSTPSPTRRRNAMAVAPIPAGYHSVTPYLILDGAADAIEFYKQAFDADRAAAPADARRQGRARRGEDRRFAGDARRRDRTSYRGPQPVRRHAGQPHGLRERRRPDLRAGDRRGRHASCGRSPTSSTAIAAARSSIRSATCGRIATHVEDVSPDEIDRRFAKMMQGG